MKKKLLGMLVAVIAVGFAACGGSSGGGGGGTTGTIQGLVKDATGQPIPLATITVVGTGLTAVTDLAGLYQLENVPAASKAVVQASATNYIDANRIVSVAGGKTVYAAIQMLTPGATGTVNAAAGGTVNDATTGASITVDPGSLAMVIKSVDAAGKTVVTKAPITGDVEVGVADLPPTSESFPGFQAVSTADPEQESMLESYGAISCVVKQNDVSVDAEFTGTATVGIPADQVATAPATIDFWSFNEEKGLWEKTGTGTKTTCDGNPCYSGAVTHCSDWNADIEIERSCITGVVKDGDGNPIPNIEVVCAGESYAGSDRGYTDANGEFQCYAKFATPAESIYVYANGASGSGPFVGPIQVSSTRREPPDCQDVGTVSYTGEPTIDWTQVTNFTEAFASWEDESRNLDVIVKTPSGLVYYDSVGSLTADPYLLLMNDAGCSPAVGKCLPGTMEEVRGYYDLPAGTYNVYVYQRDNSPLPKPADEEITVFFYSFDFAALQDANIDYTDHTAIMNYYVYDYLMTTADPGTNNTWHAFQVDVAADGSVTITPVDTYQTITSPADL